MSLPVAELVTGSVTGIGVLGLIIDRLAQKRQDKKNNGTAPPWMDDVKADIVELKGCAHANHDDIQVIKGDVKMWNETRQILLEAQGKINTITDDHLASLDKKVYDLATKP